MIILYILKNAVTHYEFRSRLATRSQCDVFDIMKEDERSLSSVDVRHQRSFSEKLESALKVSEESDNLVRKLREL